MIGKTISHYHVLEKVGAGGMGVVYRARDEQLEREVALKVLLPGALGDETARIHFRKEATALAKLNHPNIETVYEFDTQDGLDFLVMEYVSGKTLAHRLAGGPLPEKEVIRLGMQIAAALQEAHERGIVHCDLKPGNIAVTAKGQAKVLDFGLAKLLQPVEEGTTERLSDMCEGGGTLPYMSPEQLRGEPADGRADIFSLGAVLYEIATNRRAFGETLASRVIDAILHDPPVSLRALNRGISPELERIILKCLDKNPDHRYQSAKELLADLRRLEALASTGGVAPAAPPKTWRRIAKIAAYSLTGVLALAAGLTAMNVGGWRDRLMGVRETSQIRSLAVLPLENLSGDASQEYFADGMTDALITELSQIRNLRVISRTSVMRYKQTRKTLPEVARELHVDAIVEGTVSRSGSLAQVTARLIYAPTERQLWSKTYRRDLENVLVLQGEVASAVVREINVALTPQEQARLSGGRVNPAAHEAYLKGNYLISGTPEQKRKAKEFFEQAIQIDPSYAPAYAGLANYYWAITDLPPRKAMPQAEQYAEKALELDPMLARAHLALGTIRFLGDWNWAKAESEFKLALELNPNDAEAHRNYSSYLLALGREGEALAEIHRAEELDPLYIATHITAGWLFYFARQYDKAIERCQQALELDPNSAGGYDCLGLSNLAKGNYELAIAACQRAVTLSGNAPSRAVGVGQAYALAGRKSEAQQVFREIRERSIEGYVPPSFLAKLYVAFGEKEQALDQLEEAYQARDGYLVWLKAETTFDPLRSDPRFQELLHRVGL